MGEESRVTGTGWIHLEPDFESSMGFVSGLGEAVESLAEFLGADDLELPRGWMMQLG